MRYGQILRDGQNGQGLISSEGEKFAFTLEQHWASDAPPTVGMRVTMEFDDQGSLTAVHAGSVKNNLPVGIVQRDGQVGNGLVSSNGAKYSFTLEAHWKSDQPPAVGMQVHLKLDAHGQLEALYAIENNQLDQIKDKFNTLIKKIPTQGTSGGFALPTGMPTDLLEQIGKMRLGVFVGFLVVWNAMDFLQMKSFLTRGFSFMQTMGLASNSLESMRDPSMGFYGLLAWVSLLAVLLPLVWKHRLAKFGVLAPVAMLVLGTLMVMLALRREFSGLGSMLGERAAADMMRMLMNSFSLGMGFYLSLLLSVVAIASLFLGNTWRPAAGRAHSAPAPVPVAPNAGHAPAAPQAPIAAVAPISTVTPPAAATGCKQCHAPIAPSDAFCGECGSKQ